jgi:hypothetical protein
MVMARLRQLDLTLFECILLHYYSRFSSADMVSCYVWQPRLVMF